MSFFKSLFAKQKPLPTRSLTKPDELQVNDILTFGDGFALPPVIRKQQLEVIQCDTIEFKHQHFVQLIAQGSGEQLVYLSFPDNPQQLIKVSLLLTREDVQGLFDLDTFAEIFEEPGNVRLTPLNHDHNYADMVADEYIQQDFMTTGYKHAKDYRGQTPPQYNEEEHGREFEYYSLEGAQGKRLVEIYIFENGDTDVYLSFLRPANDIAELWIKEE